LRRVDDASHWFEIVTEGIPTPSVVDPDSLNSDLDPAFQLNLDPDPGFDDQKLIKITAEQNLSFLDPKLQYLSLGLLQGHPSYRRTLQPSKENIQHFKK
jgi:hypothetical protein